MSQGPPQPFDPENQSLTQNENPLEARPRIQSMNVLEDSLKIYLP